MNKCMEPQGPCEIWWIHGVNDTVNISMKFTRMDVSTMGYIIVYQMDHIIKHTIFTVDRTMNKPM